MSKSIIVDKTKRTVRYIKNSNFFTSKISHRPGTVKINQTLPFRIKFTNIGISGYGQGSAAQLELPSLVSATM